MKIIDNVWISSRELNKHALVEEESHSGRGDEMGVGLSTSRDGATMNSREGGAISIRKTKIGTKVYGEIGEENT